MTSLVKATTIEGLIRMVHHKERKGQETPTYPHVIIIHKRSRSKERGDQICTLEMADRSFNPPHNHDLERIIGHGGTILMNQEMMGRDDKKTMCPPNLSGNGPR